MAFTNLNENATSVAAANWEDATGFAAGAELEISDGSVAILNDLDQSASDIEALVITEGRTGDIGKAGTPLQCQVDNSTDARVEYRASGGRFYFTHADNTSTCEYFIANSTGGSVYIEGGTIDDLEVARVAYLEIGANAVVTNAKLGDGRGVIENNATGMTSCEIFGGHWTIKRDGTYKIHGDAVVVFDIPDSSPTMSVEQTGRASKVYFKRCATVATVTHNSGLQATVGVAERAVNLGGSAYNRGPASLARTAFRDVDTIATPTVWGGQATQIGAIPA